MLHSGEIVNGNYQVIKEIGQGGSGLVYLAYHRNLRKYIVIKRVRRGVGSLASLRAETDILKSLRHSNIPSVYDFIVRDGEVFTVMDYIDGTGFIKLPTGGKRLPEKQLTAMLDQLAGTLAYLHRHRPPVIHSDIKPDNLILTRDGQVCLIDFNISISDSVNDSLSGYSIHFASPEQLRRSMQFRAGGKQIPALDARTDIYSTGALFYYLMTGLYADTKTPAGVPAAHPPALPRSASQYHDMLACGYSDGLCRTVARCLENDKEARYRDGADLLKAVRRIHRQDIRFRRYLLLRIASWILTAAMLGGGSWLLIKGQQQEIKDDYRRAYSEFVQETESGEPESAAKAGVELLNDSRFSQILKNQPGDRIAVLQFLADHAYALEQYEDAQAYYGDALAAAKEEKLSLSGYYRDYAIALIKADQEHKASLILEEAAEEKGLDVSQAESLAQADPDLGLIQAWLSLNRGDTQACLLQVEAILEASGDGDLRARACVLAAEAMQKEKGGFEEEDRETKRLAWLQQAVEYSKDEKYLRLLAEEYWNRVDDHRRTDSQKLSYAKEALACYEKLGQRPYPRRVDIINRAVVMQFLGDYEGSIKILSDFSLKWPEDFRFPMYIAFAYDGLGNRDQASRFARQALDLYEQADDPPSGSSEEISLLKQIS